MSGALVSEAVDETAAVTVMAADARGPLGRFGALPAAVNRTDVTVAADAGTVTFACSWRFAELASRVPTSHDVLPSWLPQPRLNAGFRVAGADVSRMVAPVTSPPAAQALTVHSAT